MRIPGKKANLKPQFCRKSEMWDAVGGVVPTWLLLLTVQQARRKVNIPLLWRFPDTLSDGFHMICRG